MLLPGNGWLRLNHNSYYQITHKPVYQNNSFPVILLSGYNSPFNGWLRFTHFDLPNYPFIRIIPFNSFNQVFPSETKREKLPKAPRQAQCQMPILPRKLAPFNAILIITLNVYQTPLQRTQMAQNGIHGVQSFLRMLGNKGVQNSPTPSQLLAKVIPAVQSFIRVIIPINVSTVTIQPIANHINCNIIPLYLFFLLGLLS